MNYKGYIIKPTPENLRELDEILAGNVPNSNDKDKNDITYHNENWQRNKS